MVQNRTQHESNYPSELHRFVFECAFVKYAIVALYVAFLIQPIAPVFANELEDADTSPTVESAEIVEDTAELGSEPEEAEVVEDLPEEEVVSDVTEEVVTEEKVVAEEVTEGEEVLPVEDEVFDDESAAGDELMQEDGSQVVENATSTEDETIENSEEDVEVSGTLSNATTTEQDTEQSTDNTDDTVTEEDTASTTDQTTATTSGDGASSNESTSDEPDDATGDEVVDDTTADASSETETSDDAATQQDSDIDTRAENELSSPVEESTETASTTAVTTATSTQATTTPSIVYAENNIAVDQSSHQFNKDECVAMGDGSFFCSEAENLPEYVEDGVFSVPDADGDREIMVRVNGEEIFITDNLVDDLAPFYDGTSERVVWHSLINDRYQIASYDFNTTETEFLTDTTYNNMEPVANGDLTLWQAWIENDWEIMLFDGATTTQLTDNDMNDIAPQIRGDYILWQTQFADGWKVAMYDQKTKKIEYIGDAEGALAANPRFVLVYDSLDANGDVRTVGFDLDSGEIVPFAQVPSQLPDQLPEPQGTEETRALIQSKSTSKDIEIVDIDPTDADKLLNATSTQPTATTTDTHTLDLSTGATATATSTSDVIEDVVVTPDREKAELTVDALLQEKLNGTSTDHISDVVIPPLATTTDEVVG